MRHYAFVIFCVLFVSCPAYCSTYYIDPNGNDTTGDGSIGSPWQTIPKAVTAASAGDTIYLRGGTHNYSATITLSTSGSAGNLITLQNYQDEIPILDFTHQPVGDAYKGIALNGNYWNLKGFIVQYAGHNGVRVIGAHNILERLIARENGDTGIHLHAPASYNQVINCDSYLNRDPEEYGEDADGFGAKGPTDDSSSLGPGNEFSGCRAWNNSDDGFDFWHAGAAVIVKDCWAFRNGVNLWGFSPVNGDGNGFKLGHGSGAHQLIRCLAYSHKAHGIDINGNLSGAKIYNCICVSSSGKNFYFDEHSSLHKMRNNISYLGSVTIYTEIDDEYNTWNTGFSVSGSDFLSLDPNGLDAPRGPDGELPKLAFLRLTATSSLIDAGTDVGEPFVGDEPDLGAFEHADLTGDCEPDGDVDWADLNCLVSNWLESDCGYCNGVDFSGDNKVNFEDFVLLAENWMI
jgi:hypothetical protein